MDGQEILNNNFLDELFSLCFKYKEIINICQKYLKYQYLPTAEYKEIWKQIQEEYKYVHSVPAIGVIYENCKSNSKVLATLDKIQSVENVDRDRVIKKFEEFIKDSICISFYDNFQELYSNGKKEDAIEYLKKTSTKLQSFTLSSDYLFSSIFKDFANRQYEKKIEKEFAEEDFAFTQPITGIDELDYLFPVRIKSNPLYCVLARSGVGKTTFLCYAAVENAKRGAKVLYVTSEGTEDELQDKIDRCWTRADQLKLENAGLSEDEISKYNKIAESVIAKGGEIELHVFKQFNTATIYDVLNIVEEFEKVHGCVPDVLILDYLELFTTKDKTTSNNEEKYRRQKTAREIVNLLTSKNIKFGLTATQASNIDMSLVNSESFCLSRNDISGDKNLLDCFSLFFSLNQTETEEEADIMRLFIDKARHSDNKKKKIIRIYTDYEHGCFYNRQKTLNEFATELI